MKEQMFEVTDPNRRRTVEDVGQQQNREKAGGSSDPFFYLIVMWKMRSLASKVNTDEDTVGILGMHCSFSLSRSCFRRLCIWLSQTETADRLVKAKEKQRRLTSGLQKIRLVMSRISL